MMKEMLWSLISETQERNKDIPYIKFDIRGMNCYKSMNVIIESVKDKDVNIASPDQIHFILSKKNIRFDHIDKGIYYISKRAAWVLLNEASKNEEITYYVEVK